MDYYASQKDHINEDENWWGCSARSKLSACKTVTSGLCTVFVLKLKIQFSTATGVQ